jgi:thiol:disulfide interchange protein DsbA
MRPFSLFAVAALLLIPLISHAAGPLRHQENVSYQKIIPAQPTANTETVEVVEVFWYGCPHCHRFQPYVENWLLSEPKNVSFLRLPAILNERWAIHARAYYTAEALGVLERIHPALFDAMHNKKRSLDTQAALAGFFAEHGVDKAEFDKAFTSFAVNNKVSRARELTRRYGIDGTPAVVVNGKYRSSPSMVGSFEGLIDVIEFLVDRETATVAN